MDRRSSRDRLSNLPLGIIHTILEKIPIRDAVKTSILSKSWRYNWVTLPNLNFDVHCLSLESELKDFITQILLRHRGPINMFKFDVPFAQFFQNVDQWLIFLSRNSVKILTLKCYDDAFSRIHSSLYSLQNSLTHLEICHCTIPTPPSTFKGFLSLKCLVLDAVAVTSNTIRALLGDQTLLEELTLDNCIMGNYELRIHAPKLKSLRLKAPSFKSISLNAPLLRKMSISFGTDLAPPKNSVCTYTDFLGGLSSLEELKGSFYFFKYLSIGLDSSQVLLEFPHLRLVELSPNALYDKKVQSVFSRLSMDAPNLHKIRVSYAYYCATQLELNESAWDSACLPDFTFERLKVIEIWTVGGNNSLMTLIKWLLASSPVLETLIYEPKSQTDSELLILASKLLAFPRASTNAKILFENR